MGYGIYSRSPCSDGITVTTLLDTRAYDYSCTIRFSNSLTHVNERSAMAPLNFDNSSRPSDHTFPNLG